MTARGGGQGPEECGRAAEPNGVDISEPRWFGVGSHGQEANVVSDVRNVPEGEQARRALVRQEARGQAELDAARRIGDGV
eukprot:5823503-Alexandrium_andersonii.AAC.1